jgi:hypothetical protein
MLSIRVARLVRSVVSLAPLVHAVPRPPRRPEGVSALVRVAGDEEWIEPCLTSLAEFADEILLLDHGAAPVTRMRLDALPSALAAKMRRLDCAGADLPEVANRGLAECRFRWAFLWDADLVARTAGPAAITALKRFLAGLDPRRYHLVNVRTVELAGDLCHRFPDLPERYDPHVFTAGGPARYVWRAHRVAPDRAPIAYRPLRGGAASHFEIRYDTLETPKYYRVHRWRERSLFHVNVKSARRSLLRHFWLEWLASGAVEGLEAYTRRRVRDWWGIDDLAAAAARFMEEYCRHLVRVDEAAIGGYPPALLPYVERASYRVVYQDGRIVGRAEAPVATGV